MSSAEVKRGGEKAKAAQAPHKTSWTNNHTILVSKLTGARSPRTPQNTFPAQIHLSQSPKQHKPERLGN
jgi:hypothetical protein